MNNNLSELRKPVDFLKSAALITARNFEHWSKLAAMTSESSSVLHSTTLLETAQLLSALLAELEASSLQCRGIEQERELFRLERTAHQIHAQALEQRTAELEAKLASLKHEFGELWKGNVDLLARLATPVRLSTKYSLKMAGDKSTRAMFSGHNSAINDSAKAIRAAGFTVEGDE